MFQRGDFSLQTGQVTTMRTREQGRAPLRSAAPLLIIRCRYPALFAQPDLSLRYHYGYPYPAC